MLRKKNNADTPDCIRHSIRLDIRNKAALRTLETLHRAGYEAYLVGGAIRDALLGIAPKDFDVATAATPEQVSRLFRRSRIIGRRFQIVHVQIGSDIIEVSTFRSGGHVKQNELGRIMQDNAYGTLAQDALRRDFTCNALYYDIKNRQILDYHNGLSDIRARKLVMIGQADERYQEDPVRILRAIRLAGKLDFEISAETMQPIFHHAHLLQREPVARLFDEFIKILFSGSAQNCLEKLRQLHLHENIHPLFTAMCSIAEAPANHIGKLALQQTDARLRSEKSVSVGFVLAALFWQNLHRLWQHNQTQGMRSVAAMNEAVHSLRNDIEHGWGVPQRYTATMREIWTLQPQFENRRGARPFKLFKQPRFRAAYDFLLLRAQADVAEQPLLDWWTRFQHTNDADRQEMIAAETQKPATEPKRKRRRPRKKTSQTPQEI